MLAAAHYTPVNLNVSHKYIVIISFNQNLVIVAICVELEVIEIMILYVLVVEVA